MHTFSTMFIEAGTSGIDGYTLEERHLKAVARGEVERFRDGTSLPHFPHPTQAGVGGWPTLPFAPRYSSLPYTDPCSLPYRPLLLAIPIPSFLVAIPIPSFVVAIPTPPPCHLLAIPTPFSLQYLPLPRCHTDPFLPRCHTDPFLFAISTFPRCHIDPSLP